MERFVMTSWVLLVYGLVLCSCASMHKSDLLSKADYLPTRTALNTGNLADGLRLFPREKEAGGFITTLEDGWLRFLNADPDPERLRLISDGLEARKTLKIRREMKSFFYKVAADEYFPGEHEVVMLHLLTALGYAFRGDRAKAVIETRRAARYLQKEFGDHSEFDDPGLRMILASLWIYAGDWSSAQVDLRVAAKLSQKESIRLLAEQDAAPKDLHIMFQGVGPEVVWDPDLNWNLVGAMTNIKFTNGAEDSPSTVNPLTLASFGTKNWYERHQERNVFLRDIMMNTRYAFDASASVTAAGTSAMLGYTGAALVMALGVGSGAAVIYYASSKLPSYLAGYVVPIGLGLGLLGIAGGVGIWEETSKQSRAILDEGADSSVYYRFVRFLPTQIFAEWDNEDFLLPSKLQKAFIKKIGVLDSQDGRSKLSFHSLLQSELNHSMRAAGIHYDIAIADRELGFSEAQKFCDNIDSSLPNTQLVKSPVFSEVLDDVRSRNRVLTHLWAVEETSVDAPCRIFQIDLEKLRTPIDCEIPQATVCVKRRWQVGS
jgi:hypothetical protein